MDTKEFEKEFNRLKEVVKGKIVKIDPKIKKTWLDFISKTLNTKKLNDPYTKSEEVRLSNYYALMLSYQKGELTLMREYMTNNSCLGILLQCYINETDCLKGAMSKVDSAKIKSIMEKCANMYNINSSYISQDTVDLIGLDIPKQFIGYNDLTNLLLLINIRPENELKKFIEDNF